MGFLDKVVGYIKHEIELTREYYRNGADERNTSSNESALPVTTDQTEERIPCYYCGHLIRIFPEPGWPYSKHIGSVFSANSLISDDISYDLTRIESIRAIVIPPYEIHGESRIDKDLGNIGTIEYFLRVKGDRYWKSGQHDLALACYAKATEMMIVSDSYWSPDDIDFIVNKLSEIGNYSLAKKWEAWIDDKLCLSEEEIDSIIEREPKAEDEETKKGARINEDKKNQPLSAIDKERIMVERITTADMCQFTSIPYDLNCPIQKLNTPKAHPYAYIELDGANIEVAKSELRKINSYIVDARSFIPELPKKFCIDVDKVAFSEYSPNYGYSKLICTPYTFSGKISNIPLTLLFMSRRDVMQYQVIGNLEYSADGCVVKADVNVWSRKSYETPGTGWIFFFNTVNGVFLLDQVNSTVRRGEDGMLSVVYRSDRLIEEEAEKGRDKKKYEWLQHNLPEVCPKSFSGFRRMKVQNSKNYQKIVEAARKLGYRL